MRSFLRMLVPLCVAGYCTAQDEEESIFEFKYSVMGVVLEGEDVILKEFILENAAAAQSQFLIHGNLSVEFFSNEGMSLPGDVNGVLTVGGCELTRRLQEEVEEQGTFQLAVVTEPVCLRLSSPTSISAVAIPRESHLPQVLLDLRQEGSLPWKDAVLFLDNSVDDRLVGQLVGALAQSTREDDPGAAVALFRVPQRSRHKHLQDVLASLDLGQGTRGARFLSLLSASATYDLLFVARSEGALGPSCQWLVVLPADSRSEESLSGLLSDGDNVSFLRRISENHSSSSNCSFPGNASSSVRCFSSALLTAATEALERTLEKEVGWWEEASAEEWALERPSWSQHSAALMAALRTLLLQGKVECGGEPCDRWKIRAVQGGDSDAKGGVELLLAGEWTPLLGLTMADQLFPNVQGGMRSRLLLVASFHLLKQPRRTVQAGPQQ